jgi:flagellin
MPLSINSNIASLDAQIRLGRAQDAVGRNMAILSSGLRIANVSDDPAGLGIATQFETTVRSYNQAARNTNDGISMLQTVDGALGQIHGVLQRMRELAVQSSNGTLASADRVNIGAEFTQLQSEITRVATSTKFGNVTLLNAASTVTIQVGVNATANVDTVNLAFNQEDSITLKVDAASIKVDTQTAAQTSLAAIDTAIASISSDRAGLGALQNRLHVAMDNDTVFSKNLSAAVSRIRDADVAQTSGDLARSQVLVQAGVAVLAQANQAPNLALQLLRG